MLPRRVIAFGLAVVTLTLGGLAARAEDPSSSIAALEFMSG